jgi:hypothetical protein
MQIRRGKPPGSGRLARTGVELSREARVRLAWMDFDGGCHTVAHTCRHFGIRRQTFYGGRGRDDPHDWSTRGASSLSLPATSADLVFSLDEYISLTASFGDAIVRLLSGEVRREEIGVDIPIVPT